jgi:selT/selW/selH-like putative selenoprotein
MKRNFVSAKKYLESEFPGLHVDGDNYPPPPLIELLMKVLQGIQLMAMGLIIFGDGLWTNILRFRAVPLFYYKVKEYSFQMGVLVFFILPQMLNKYIVTGAFEMILDGVTVYSKLETGRMPHAGDLLAPLEASGLLKAGR